MSSLPWLDELSDFPPVHHALTEPEGLLAAGGDLSPERLINAYEHGIFPWFDDDQPILWWSPDPRAVLFPSEIKISRSLRKRIKRQEFDVRFDTQFDKVVEACAAPRINESGTWITDDMYAAYCELHRLGVAHSIECFKGEQLVGGLYGVSLGKMFFGESMFHRQTDASKVAFAYLARFLELQNATLIDCQIENPHLNSLGSRLIDRQVFTEYLQRNRNARPFDWSIARWNEISWDFNDSNSS